MALSLKDGELIPLALLLEDRDQTKYVRARIRDNDGLEIVGSPFNVPHLSDGFYFNGSDAAMTANPNLVIEYDVFDDDLFTTPSAGHYPTAERIDLDEIGDAVDDLVNASKSANVEALVQGDEDLEASVSEGEIIEVELGDDDLEGDLEGDSSLDVSVSDGEIDVELGD